MSDCEGFVRFCHKVGRKGKKFFFLENIFYLEELRVIRHPFSPYSVKSERKYNARLFFKRLLNRNWFSFIDCFIMWRHLWVYSPNTCCLFISSSMFPMRGFISITSRLQMADLGGDDISGGEFPFWGPMMSFDSEDWRLDATQQINFLTNSNSWNEQKVSETEV